MENENSVKLPDAIFIKLGMINGKFFGEYVNLKIPKEPLLQIQSYLIKGGLNLSLNKVLTLIIDNLSIENFNKIMEE